jgi:hypothetical protein
LKIDLVNLFSTWSFIFHAGTKLPGGPLPRKEASLRACLLPSKKSKSYRKKAFLLLKPIYTYCCFED